ncbi:MAG: HAD-IA family hydrolase [Thermoanaerobaculia bacterium]
MPQPPAPIRAIFFDAGQTLLFPDPAVEEVYAAAFASYGLAVSVTDVHRAVHATWRVVAQRREAGEDRWGQDGAEAGFWRRFVSAVFAGVGGGELPEPLLQELVRHFQDGSKWKAFPEVFAVLAQLRAEGYRLLIVSNWDSSLPLLLANLGLTPYFDAVIVSAEIGASKPSPAIFAEALRLAGVSPDCVLHVGDSRDEDYEGARAAGLHALLLDRSGRAGTAVPTIRSLDEIAAWLRSRP